jgi:hypothetical protein
MFAGELAMGHGFIEYGGGVMLNCHEGISARVGDYLDDMARRPEYLGIAPAVRFWKEALEMPNGCSAIKLDLVLPDEATKKQFVEALTEVHGRLEGYRAKGQVRQLIAFLMLGESALEGVFKPLRT